MRDKPLISPRECRDSLGKIREKLALLSNPAVVSTGIRKKTVPGGGLWAEFSGFCSAAGLGLL